MKTVIFAGGFGTRIATQGSDIPKPMIQLDGKPMLWHIMDSYARQGFDDFVIALGYRAGVIKDYFLHIKEQHSDFEIDLSTGSVKFISDYSPSWKVTLVDTGVSTMTGGRLKRLEHLLGSTFMLTYGDGLSNIDLAALLSFHRSQDALLTVSAVNPSSRYGKLELEDNGRVSDFVEKPEFSDSWINGGFMVVEPKVLELISGDEVVFEAETMPLLASSGRMSARRHTGFWHCMDTLRDKAELEAMIASGSRAWQGPVA